MNRWLGGAFAAILLALATACEGTPPAGPAPSPTPTSKTVLVAPTYRMGPMPVSPTWQPPGPAVSPSFVNQAWQLSYGQRLTLTVTYGELSGYDISPRGPSTPITMLGLTGGEYRVVLGEGPLMTVWAVKDASGQSVMVAGSDQQAVRRFGAGLRRKPLAVDPPFEFTLLPENLVPVRVHSHAMEFATSAESEGDFVSVFYTEPAVHEEGPRGARTSINGHEAYVDAADALCTVVVLRPGGLRLTVSAPTTGAIDCLAVQRITAGIAITAHAVPFKAL